jgi:hypothetical protein
MISTLSQPLRLVVDGGRNPDADTIGSLPLRPMAWETPRREAVRA